MWWRCVCFVCSFYFCLCHARTHNLANENGIDKWENKRVRSMCTVYPNTHSSALSNTFPASSASLHILRFIWKCVDFSAPFFSFIRSKSCIYPIFAHMSARNNQTKWGVRWTEEKKKKKKKLRRKKNEISLNKYRLRRHISRALSFEDIQQFFLKKIRKIKPSK